jgi:hypothetical protein
VNLRTFLPPPATPTASPPVVGSPAPELPDGAPREQPIVLAFLRHTGCPFAEWTARRMRAAAAEHDDIAWVAVSHAPREATEEWARAIGGVGGVLVLSDPERASYAAWGLGRSSLGHFAGRRSLIQVAKLARRGIRNRYPHGSRWQQAGTFAVDAGKTIRWRHLPAHAGDIPDLAKAASSLK